MASKPKYEHTISLNVGGVQYATSLSTLTKYEDSMFGGMFGSELPTAKDKDGAYFIDRDGQLFRHILNFLRCDELCLPDDFKELELLKKEADFYQIAPLIAALESASVPDEEKIVEIRDFDDSVRSGHYELTIVAPARFFGCLPLSPTTLHEIEILGESRKFEKISIPSNSRDRNQIAMWSLGNGIIHVHCRDSHCPTTRPALGELLRSNGSRLLHSSVAAEADGGAGAEIRRVTTSDKWLVKDSLLDRFHRRD